LWGISYFTVDINDFRRNLIFNLGLYAEGIWLARNLSDSDISQGCSQTDTRNPCAASEPSKT
ncbi:hypothetical protein FD754_001486, partial [Muntiacus muntjak]